MAQAQAQLSEAQRELTLAREELAVQRQSAAERQKRFGVLSTTFKRKEEGFVSQLASARDESSAAQAELQRAMQDVTAVKQVGCWACLPETQ